MNAMDAELRPDRIERFGEVLDFRRGVHRRRRDAEDLPAGAYARRVDGLNVDAIALEKERRSLLGQTIVPDEDGDDMGRGRDERDTLREPPEPAPNWSMARFIASMTRGFCPIPR
ncbi:hypothetical protein LZC95_09410 [Pendulispora brunnea]|uniref:Uncharacterized protein n=1 Tax=Pendulispora brunnea TaxID=2905690 RepID=A0ABZ2KEB9_9BACT